MSASGVGHGRPRWSSLWIVLPLVLAIRSLAAADEPARVVIVGPGEGDPIVLRLHRELGLLGIEVEIVDPPAGRVDLAALAREKHAAAAAAVGASPPGVTLWIDPEGQPPGAASEIRVDAALAGSSEPRMIALRAVEMLRGRLLRVPAQPSGDAGTEDEAKLDAAPPTPPPARLPAPAGLPAPPVADASDGGAPHPPAVRARPSFSAGVAAVGSPGSGLGTVPQLWLGARWAPARRVELELVALLPTLAANVSAPEGSATLRTGAIGAGAMGALVDPASRFFATAGGGIGALLAAYEGQAQAPWKPESGLRCTMFPYVRAGGGLWISPWLALRADGLIGFALPEPVLWIAGRPAADFGEPALVLAASVEVRP